MEHDEWLDLVDDNDIVVERMLRSDVYAVGKHNFRAINLFIKNSAGQLWIPRRIATKKLFPLGLDFSCAGHVESGHNYDQTLKKEVQEELNIDIDEFEVRTLGKTTSLEGFSCFATTYEIRSDEVPDYSPKDFFEYFWFTPEELVQRIEAGDYAKGDLAPIVRRYYLHA